MTIKIQCLCGTRYSFEVEPQGGVMPFQVNCPACHADGTEAANRIIAKENEPPPPSETRLRMAVSATPAPPASPAPTPRPPMAKPVSGSTLQRIQAEARNTRRKLWAAGGVVLAVAAVFMAWGWYSFVGSRPHLASKYALPAGDAEWHTEFLEGGRVLLASSSRVILHDFRADKDVWSTPLPENGEFGLMAPQVVIHDDNLWVCSGNQVARLDLKTGAVKQTIPINGEMPDFAPTDSSLLVVSATGETSRIAMRIDLATGETTSQKVTVPKAEKHAMPDELPPNVAPTADVLLAQATEEQKFNKPLDAVSSQFFSAGQNLIELRVTLLEPKVEWVKSMKPRGPSVINGNTTAGTPIGDVESEVFNDIKRDRTGGVKPIDESTYEVRLRRWLGDKVAEWKGNVTGVPSFFSLGTVDLVTAGKGLIVFDKQNNKLFDSKLSFPVSARFAGENTAPAVERAGVLYFFDQGVLTALSLPDGQVKWRLTSVNISHVQFDDQGAMYIDSTTAAPEDIQYSEQIKFDSTPPLILKADPHSGKILWQTTGGGQHCFLSGKFVYTVSRDQGGGMLGGLADAVHAPQQDTSVRYHIYRLDPQTGGAIWSFFRSGAPQEEAFQKNWFVLRYGNELDAWSYLQL